MTPRMHAWSSERGASLVIALLAVMMLTALGAALVLTTTTETMLTYNFQTGQQTLYAADAGLERSVLNGRGRERSGTRGPGPCRMRNFP